MWLLVSLLVDVRRTAKEKIAISQLHCKVCKKLVNCGEQDHVTIRKTHERVIAAYGSLRRVTIRDMRSTTGEAHRTSADIANTTEGTHQ